MHHPAQNPAGDENAMTPGKLQDKEIAALFQQQRDLIERLAAVQAEMRALGLEPRIPGEVAEELRTSGAGILKTTEKDGLPALTRSLTDPDSLTSDDIRAILSRPGLAHDDTDTFENTGSKSAV